MEKKTIIKLIKQNETKKNTNNKCRTDSALNNIHKKRLEKETKTEKTYTKSARFLYVFRRYSSFNRRNKDKFLLLL